MTEPTDRGLVRHYWPVALRPAFDALFALDDALCEIVTSSTQPALGAIRLAWWREALERLDHAPPPPEPRLRAASAELLSRGVSGTMLSELEDGWAALLDEQPDLERVRARGAKIFLVGAKLLGGEDRHVATAGELFVQAQLARKRLVCGSHELGDWSGLAGHRFERTLRPLTGLARLAARDVEAGQPLEPEATPGRAAALLLHRWFGKVLG